MLSPGCPGEARLTGVGEVTQCVATAASERSCCEMRGNQYRKAFKPSEVILAGVSDPVWTWPSSVRWKKLDLVEKNTADPTLATGEAAMYAILFSDPRPHSTLECSLPSQA